MVNIMYEKMAMRIAVWSCNNCQDDSKEYEVVAYGIEVAIEAMIETIILISIGIILNQVKEVLIILFSFCSIRIHAGGIHAKTIQGCTAFMIMVEIGTILCNKNIELSNCIFCFCGILCNGLIWLYAPNGSKSNKLLDVKEKKQKKRYALFTTNLLLFLAFIFDMKVLIVIPILIEILSLLVDEMRWKYAGNEARYM